MSKPDLNKLRIERSSNASSADTIIYTDKLYKTNNLLKLFTTLLLLVVLYLVFFRSSAKEKINASSAATTQPSVSYNSSANYLNATGYVVAQRKAAVASKATGRLIELKVVEGDLVKKDDILGILDHQDLDAALKEAEANVSLLKSKVQWSQAEVDDAKSHFERMQSARKTNAISQTDYDQAQARYKKALSEFESANYSVNLAEAQLSKTMVDKEYTYIRAPFDGTVLTKNADVGEIVAPFGSSSNARAAIVTIADMSSLEVEADVSEANLSKIFLGQECEITLDSFASKTYKGTVSKIVPTVDRSKATVLTKIKFLDIDEHVIPEMSAKVNFKLANN